MKSIVFFNNKGGVGKTTLICNVAAYMSLEFGKKVLVIDADPQCNTTSYCLSEIELEKLYANEKRETIETFLNPVRRGKGYVQSRIGPIKTERFGFDLIAGDPKLALSEDLLATDWDPATSGKPRGLQTTLVFSHLSNLYRDYDFVFYDVGPSLGALNRAILISCDYFIIPMSVDVFSLMALSNINQSLKNWRSGIIGGLSSYEDNEGEEYCLGNDKVKWKLSFLGYAMQQYKAKTVRGERLKVSAYEKIAKKFPKIMASEIVNEYAKNKSINFDLGQIENMNSLIPLSQLAHAPLFYLKSRDGVVGSHFTKVNDARDVYKKLCNNLLTNIKAIEK
ncbi:ParA family protein [Serratia marcescens]|uniref:ParA family protein n=1 Tax=Serratia TaxID=613 RepID=UPI0018D5B93E|nr:ParA family protein [Serratia marcescens]MBH2572084.1 ParA family protein [Serratia marcescens]MBH2610648.1 ParA family protein [Serratia marcescens]MBH2928995.1 ParA family protein [Serratia marcescens]MBH2940334.1 ParA family protein [Serratia marcescens]MBN5329329.1 ParA family protein [Serratia marcescens]